MSANDVVWPTGLSYQDPPLGIGRYSSTPKDSWSPSWKMLTRPSGPGRHWRRLGSPIVTCGSTPAGRSWTAGSGSRPSAASANAWSVRHRRPRHHRALLRVCSARAARPFGSMSPRTTPIGPCAPWPTTRSSISATMATTPSKTSTSAEARPAQHLAAPVSPVLRAGTAARRPPMREDPLPIADRRACASPTALVPWQPRSKSGRCRGRLPSPGT